MSKYEYTCAYCRRVVRVERSWQVQKFCSKSCAASYGNKLRAGKTPTIEPIPYAPCVFQPESINCTKKDCLNCGWNPVVAKARLDAIRRKYETECTLGGR